MKKIIGIIMTLLITGLYPLNSYALSCVEPGTPREEFEKSDVVFHGYVKDYHTSSVLKDEVYVIEVKEVYKGEIQTETIKVYDPLGFWLSERVKEGKEYLFYGNYGNEESGLNKDKIYISPCGKTTAWEQGEKHVDEFPIVKHMQTEEGAYEGGSYENDTEKVHASPYTIGTIVLMSILSLWFIIRKDKRDSKKE